MLTREQEMARDHLFGPCLVTAGPGSGKTRVLTERIIHLLQYTSPDRICVITFTRAAAEQMKKRFQASTDQKTAEEVTFGTFHSVFYRWLLSWHVVDSKSEILDRDNQEVPAFLLGQWDAEAYRNWKKEHHYIDFDDIIDLTEEALSYHHPDQMYDFFLIDEFQDIDQKQYEVVRKMVGKTANLFVVGDEDQSIYGFRGSFSSVMMQFLKDYPKASHLFLSVNFRCSQEITKRSVQLISHNKQRYDKKLRSASGDHTPMRIHSYKTTLDELRNAARRIRHLHIMGKVSYSDMAVLSRTGREADMMIQALREAGIPYKNKIRSSEFIHRQFLDIGQDIEWILNAEKDSVKEENIRKMERYFPIVRQMNRPDLRSDEIIEKEQLERLFKRMNSGSEKKKAMDLIWNSAYIYFLMDRMKKNGLPFYYPLLQFCRLDKEEKSGVFVNTLHQSKGLEFRAVWIIGVNEGSLPHTQSFDLPEAMEEERRLLYVGMTRAKKYLSLSFSEEMPPSRFLSEINS